MIYEATLQTKLLRKSKIVNPHKGKGTMMSTYSVVELLQKWKLGELTAEQALGYLLQNMSALVQRLTDAEKRIQHLEQRMNAKP